MRNQTDTTKNKAVYLLTTFGLVLILLFNLTNLQLVQGSKYFFESKNSHSTSTVTRAARGIIYDRNGVKLVENQPIYNVFIYRYAVSEEKRQLSIDNLSKLFKKDVREIYTQELEKIKSVENINEVKIFSQQDYNPYIFQIEANPENYPAVYIEKTTIRKYLYPELMSHIIGYTGEITLEDYETERYDYGDTIGKFGIEQGYDEMLRGKNGRERVYRYLSEGKKVSSTVQQKENGKDISLTIDVKVQKELYEVIQEARKLKKLEEAVSFAVVVEDVGSGEILGMANYPNFDANLFARGISNKDYQLYLENPGKPLTNKAIQYAQAPGSTLKTLTDIVALQEGAVDDQTTFYTGGTYEYGGVVFQDANRVNHGELDLVRGLCVSSNISHLKTALALDEQSNGQAAELIQRRFSKIGLDSVSSLNLGSEAVGYYPTPEGQDRKGRSWRPGDLLNASFGQGDVLVTPLGAAKLASTLGNKGRVIEQSIVKKERMSDHSNEELGIADKHFNMINEGMMCSTERNNAVTDYDLEAYPMFSSKTGTAQTGQFVDEKELIHGWEISYAPSDDPRIAMSVFIENGQSGYYAGYVSREFYKFWFDTY